MIKRLGVWDESVTIQILIIDNHADIPTLAAVVRNALPDCDVPGVNIRVHGIYAWGATPFDAQRQIETFGYMFKVFSRIAQLISDS